MVLKRATVEDPEWVLHLSPDATGIIEALEDSLMYYVTFDTLYCWFSSVRHKQLIFSLPGRERRTAVYNVFLSLVIPIYVIVEIMTILSLAKRLLVRGPLVSCQKLIK